MRAARTVRHWDQLGPVALLLLPLAVLFAAASGLRRMAYRIGLFPSHRMPVPVIVVGNITVGGTGKTPFVQWLVQELRAHGRHPAIVTRGYGARDGGPAPVNPGDAAAEAGDEPVLLARNAGCPVWRGSDRVAAARALLAAHPECDVIISDDGLQHYRLARDLEIAMVDGARGFGNGLPLPAGPLREPVSRLARCDFVVVKGRALPIPGRSDAVSMALVPGPFRQLIHPHRVATADDFAGTVVHAVAGIAAPETFFRSLEAMGLAIERHGFADHHAFTAADLAFDDGRPVVMTEKDAVKSIAFARPEFWSLPVTAALPDGFGTTLAQRLAHGTRSETPRDH
ncbi:MAG: tetraacyldisaccharide 4'-kinase, partial [Burkholderiales bacterium]|nr:tetraacyldisaccharide 4'-kinase [Burkholderiales bacterium]